MTKMKALLSKMENDPLTKLPSSEPVETLLCITTVTEKESIVRNNDSVRYLFIKKVKKSDLTFGMLLRSLHSRDCKMDKAMFSKVPRTATTKKILEWTTHQISPK